MKLCQNCVNPIKGNEETCFSCDYQLNHKDYGHFWGAGNIFEREFNKFIDSKNHGKIIYAFSGGLDSAVVLCKLVPICKSKEIELIPVTIDYGFKGRKTQENINNIIDFLEIDNLKLIDIQNQPATKRVQARFGEGIKVYDFYKKCLQETILPCGPLCNSIIDRSYKQVLDELGDKSLVTGGDTPVYNKGNFSIVWPQPLGFDVIRGAFSLGGTKKKNQEYILEHDIPWENPLYGGYDTDCLMSGTILYKMFNGNPDSTYEETLDKFKILYDYLSDRVRWKVIDRDIALENLTQLELISNEGLNEVEELQ